MNVAIYARVSTDAQAEKGYSLGAQIADCTEKAKSLGATVIREFVDDGYSGAYLERPALDSLRQSLKAGMFNAVVVYDIDRLSRNLSHQLIITDDIENNGAQLYFVKSDYKDSPEGRLFYAIRGAFSGYEREKFRERTMRGRLAMLKQGKVITDSHVYGYDFDKENHVYTINTIEASAVKEIYRLYLSGFGGTSALTAHLNAHLDEFPPPNQRKWNTSTVWQILHREMYTGKFYSNKIYHFRTGIKSSKKGIRPRSEWIEMRCPAVISEEDFRQSCALLKKNKTLDHHGGRQPVLFQGLLRCGKCGHTLHVNRARGVAYYICYRKGADGNNAPGCGARTMQSEAVDNALWDLIADICKSPGKIAEYVRKMHPAAGSADAEDDRKKKLQHIKDQRAAILQWVSSQLLTTEEATSRLTALKKAENQLMREYTCKPAETALSHAQAVYEAVLNCPPSPSEKRRVVRQIIDHIDILRTDASSGVKNYNLSITVHFA